MCKQPTKSERVNLKQPKSPSHLKKKQLSPTHIPEQDLQLASFATLFSNPLLIIIHPAPNCKIRFASISLSFPEFDIFFRSNLQISAGDSLEKFHIFQNCSIILFRHFKFIFFIWFWKPTQKNWKNSSFIKNRSGSSLLIHKINLAHFFYKFYLNKS